MPIIKISNLHKHYLVGSEEIKALNGVSIEIEKNEYIAIMGPSGSGKSTLMNMLGCLDTPTEGTYELNGINVSELDDNELAQIRNKEIGFVFQTFNLLPRSNCIQNVELVLIYAGIKSHLRKEKAIDAIKTVGLEHRMYHKPNELSGGERQRIAVARALVNNPSIILADEPTGNLDTKTGDEIMKLFSNIHNAGNTIIVVTHEEYIAQHAQKIIRVKDGQIEKVQIVYDRILK